MINFFLWFLNVLYCANSRIAVFCATILKVLILVHEIHESTNDWLVLKIVNERKQNDIGDWKELGIKSVLGDREKL